MKKAITLIVVMFYLISKTYSYDYSLSNKDKIIINKLSYKISKLLSAKSIKEKTNFINKLNNIEQKNNKNKNLLNIIKEVKINTWLYDYKNEYTKKYSDFWINYKYIQEKWIQWHNEVRWKMWSNLYSYDDRLNNTAYQWSKHQSFINKMTHERQNWDWYYNYHRIENWFQDRLVKCKPVWWVTSSESIWKFWYYCKTKDCSKELEDSLKVIFDIYLAEKNLWFNYNAHYRWITHKNLNKIWLWVYIKKTDEKDYYEYYVTTHYCTTFIN